ESLGTMAQLTPQNLERLFHPHTPRSNFQRAQVGRKLRHCPKRLHVYIPPDHHRTARGTHREDRDARFKLDRSTALRALEDSRHEARLPSPFSGIKTQRRRNADTGPCEWSSRLRTTKRYARTWPGIQTPWPRESGQGS